MAIVFSTTVPYAVAIFVPIVVDRMEMSYDLRSLENNKLSR